jgi:hydroxymethylglutaryl-CoA reductase
MPVRSSRLAGFYRLSVEERREALREVCELSDEAMDALADGGALTEEAADHMIENVIGRFTLPLGLATNFVIDGEQYLIPFAIEESSVVAAASNMAKRCRDTGGFRSSNDPPVMLAQVQVLDVEDVNAAEKAVLDAEEELMRICNERPSTMIRLGGGLRRLTCHKVEALTGTMLIVHLHVDVRDAMGANAVNTMAELVAPRIESLTGGRVLLRILSNLATERMARIEARFRPESMDDGGDAGAGAKVIDAILEAYAFAAADPYRAATHNKGVMNAISAVAIACGQDWRAIEAGCHAWAAVRTGTYTSMTTWHKDAEGCLVGRLETPMAVGTVGGASKVHPTARACLELLGINGAGQLASVLAAAGLAQNLGAMRALATSGIQAGHMRLHARNMAVSAGAEGHEIEQVAERLATWDGPRTQTTAQHILDALRRDG